MLGHGVNLPCETLLFAETTKFDGKNRRDLHPWEIAQIAGRAGRYGFHEPRDFKAPVAPNWRHVDTISRRLGVNKLYAVLNIFMQQLIAPLVKSAWRLSAGLPSTRTPSGE